MFDIGWSELLILAAIAIIFVGPKDLPRMMRTIGQYVGKVRAMARDFQSSFEDLARETELEELRKEVS
ncbi:MAG: Sec-independent protein translocase protein TatB, partial [Parvibaculum sp.]